MPKFKKDKQGIINQVKENFQNLNDQQKLMQFQMAWEGVAPKNATGWMGRAAQKASAKAPGVIYKRMRDNFDKFIVEYCAENISDETIFGVEKDIIGNFYDTSWKSAGKKLTKEQKVEYGFVQIDLRRIIEQALEGKYYKKDEKILRKIRKDIKESEKREKNQMIKDFGLFQG